MLVKTVEEFRKCKFLDLMAVDTETTSLNPREAKLVGIGWGDEKEQYCIDWGICDFQEEAIEKFKQVFKTNRIIFHNAKFDMKIFKQVLNIDFPEKIDDTMIMHWLLDENNGHGLKELAVSILKKKVTKYEDVPKEPTLFDDIDSIREKMATYCCADVENTFELYLAFNKKIKEEKLDFCYENIELPLIKVLADIELRGIKVDKENLKALSKKADAILLEKEALIRALVGNDNFNIRSSKQLRELIFDKLGMEPENLTPAGVPSTDNEALTALSKKNGAVKAIVDYREFDKLNGTYLKGLQEKMEGDFIYADFMQHRTRSGRLASANPNLQNIPARSDEFNVRQAFIPRDGYKFVIADYSQIELRVMAYYSQEPTMIKEFQEGGDIHQLTADMVGCTRKHAKSINFGMIYGLSYMSLAKDLGVPEATAEHYIDVFFGQYKKLKDYIAYIQKMGLACGYVVTLANRRRRFPKVTKSTTRGEVASIKRQLINTRIQGSAADLMKIGMLRAYKALKPLDASILIQIHDELVVEVKEEQVGEAQVLIKEAMEKAVTFNIPTPVDMKVADRWVK
jgi:DNA polymerase-1